jgi:hypothetical protein
MAAPTGICELVTLVILLIDLRSCGRLALVSRADLTSRYIEVVEQLGDKTGRAHG